MIEPIVDYMKNIENYLFCRLKPFLIVEPPSDVSLDVSYKQYLGFNTITVRLTLPDKSILKTARSVAFSYQNPDQEVGFWKYADLAGGFWNDLHNAIIRKGLGVK